jgi:hypothetical protein
VQDRIEPLTMRFIRRRHPGHNTALTKRAQKAQKAIRFHST